MFTHQTLCAAELKRKYGDLEGELLAVSITRPTTRAPLGIVLGGDREPTVQAAYVLALDPKGLVAQKHLMQVGDQILEVRYQLPEPDQYRTLSRFYFLIEPCR